MTDVNFLMCDSNKIIPHPQKTENITILSLQYHEKRQGTKKGMQFRIFQYCLTYSERERIHKNSFQVKRHLISNVVKRETP